MRIGAFQRFSLVDYPGKTCSILFTVGCNLRCPFCHNGELVIPNEFPPLIPFETIESFLSTRVGLLDAVEFTGGEPLLQVDIVDAIKRVKDMGFLVKLDTNGTFPNRLKEIIPFVDYIAMDIKAPFERYSDAVGAEISPSLVKESIAIIKKSNKDYEFRTTAFKNFFKSTEDFEQIGEEISRAKAYYIQRPHFDKILNPNYHFEVFSDSELLKIKAIMQSYADFVEIR